MKVLALGGSSLRKCKAVVWRFAGRFNLHGAKWGEEGSLVCHTRNVVFLLEWCPLEADVRIAVNFEGLFGRKPKLWLLRRWGVRSHTHTRTISLPSAGRVIAAGLMDPHS